MDHVGWAHPEVRFQRVREAAREPVYSSGAAAGADLFAAGAVVINPGGVVQVPTGIALELPAWLWGRISPRSGRALEGLVTIEGTLDPDYRGELFLIVASLARNTTRIEVGDRLAQLILLPRIVGRFSEAETLSPTLRGSGGFGSTGR